MSGPTDTETAAAGEDGVAEREAILRDLGAVRADVPALLDRLGAPFPAPAPGGTYPWPDEPCVAAWARYAAAAETRDAAAVLAERLVQLRFPVAAGMSSDPAYLAATRRGALPAGAAGALLEPGTLRLLIHQTAAGRLPVLVAASRDAFVALARALTRRNEPSPVPDSMGACIVGGYNNWNRVAGLRRAWAGDRGRRGLEAGDAAWAAEFASIVPRKELYQDRFVLLSSGPYSGAPAAALAVDPDVWPALSVRIRLEHECAHYVTRRVFGVMRNTLLDEVLADYAGLVAATGAYRAEWFLYFMGLERAPRYRTGGRLENYLAAGADAPLPARARRVLHDVVVRAAHALGEWDAGRGRGGAWPLAEQAAEIIAVARLGLERLAAPDGARRLAAAAALAPGRALTRAPA